MKLIKQTYRFSYYLLETESICADVFVVHNQVPNRIVAIFDYDKEQQKVYEVKFLGSGVKLIEILTEEIRLLFNERYYVLS